MAVTDDVSLDVSTTAEVTSVSFDQDEIELFAYSSEAVVSVQAIFDDDAVRNSDLGTTFISTAPDVATVDPAGVVSARGVGEAMLIATNGRFESAMLVRVSSAPADYDSDGVVDRTDLDAFFDCFTGVQEIHDPSGTSVACRDYFDFDADGDIDCGDHEQFIDRWTGPLNTLPLFPRCDLQPNGFRRGDSNRDGNVNISDAIRTAEHLFQRGPRLGCHDAADMNDDGVIDVSDSVATLLWLFVDGGFVPPAPGVEGCGSDPTEDELDCVEATFCDLDERTLVIGGVLLADGNPAADAVIRLNNSGGWLTEFDGSFSIADVPSRFESATVTAHRVPSRRNDTSREIRHGRRGLGWHHGCRGHHAQPDPAPGTGRPALRYRGDRRTWILRRQWDWLTRLSSSRALLHSRATASSRSPKAVTAFE